MLKDKTSLTAEEEVLVKEVFEKYIAMQTLDASEADIINIVNLIWGDIGLAPPKVILCDSPAHCKKTCGNTEGYLTYWNMWLCSYAATYDFAQQIGVEFDKDKLHRFLEWCRCCQFVLFNDDVVYVSRKPVTLKFNDAGQLHNSEGKSCEYADGWGIYSINGVSVDEQIVMHPETQTVHQIRKEENEEVKRIRIERFGWDAFLTEIGAELIDERVNDIEGTKEFLFTSETDKMTALLCICPSTAKEFVLEIDPSIKTCREAQAFLSNGMSERIISAS
jgi:hypothetical protein